MRIGILAERVGLSSKTIRYYEQIGILPAPRRAASGYREYADADVERLRFIRRAKLLGLSLDQIREILTIRARGTKPCSHVLALLDQELEAIDRQLHALRDLRTDLKQFRDEAAEFVDREGGVCPVIDHVERYGLPRSPRPKQAGLKRTRRS